MKWRIATAALTVALLGSNLYWMVGAVDDAVGRAYRTDALYGECHALDEALAVVPLVSGGASKADVLAAAREASGDGDGFEDDGVHVVGRLGYRFAGDRLVAVERSWSPGACE